MEMFLDYLWVFLIGGLVCMIGQILIITTNITSARILVTFVIVGVFLEAIGVFDYISAFAGAGINVPIIGFGASLQRALLVLLRHKDFMAFSLVGLPQQQVELRPQSYLRSFLPSSSVRTQKNNFYNL